MQTANIPMRFIGPVRITGDVLDVAVEVPMATFETTLWPSTSRGAKVSRESGGIAVSIIDECMTRSILLQAGSAAEAQLVYQALPSMQDELNALVMESSRFCRLKDSNMRVVGNLIYLRLSFETGDASGHNMATLASQNIQSYLLRKFDFLRYVSVSANYCMDKKAGAVNSILGRGKYTVAEIRVPRAVCQTILKTTPEAIVDLYVKKNLLGSVVAGGLHTANAHFANILLAMYLATGQDAANIVEGSQGLVFAEVSDDALYFSVTIPNLIVGTVGHGKTLDFVQSNLERLGCNQDDEPGCNARRLAAIIAATVLCGELSLLAALTNPGELMRAHQLFERGSQKNA